MLVGLGWWTSRFADFLLLRWFRRETHENLIKNYVFHPSNKKKTGALDRLPLKIIYAHDREEKIMGVK